VVQRTTNVLAAGGRIGCGGGSVGRPGLVSVRMAYLLDLAMVEKTHRIGVRVDPDLAGWDQ